MLYKINMGYMLPCKKWLGRKKLSQVFKQKKNWLHGWVVVIKIQNILLQRICSWTRRKNEGVCCSFDPSLITIETMK